MLYNNLSGYFRKKYGKRLSKICIDGGFSCPNRDGTVGVGGCIYCGERGAGEHISPCESIEAQVKRALETSEDDEMFVAYFQNFTNTYAPVEVLRKRYDSALIDNRIKVLAIGTRPDCISEEICRLIAGYKEKCNVWVELGLQTANDETAKTINRGYPRGTFEYAMELLKKYGLDVCVHLIVGLPGETMEDIKKTSEYLSRFDIFGVKIHSIYVMKDTKLCELYERGEYMPPSFDFYIDAAVYILTHLHPAVTVHRLTGDCPEGMLVAPEWNRQKHTVIDAIVAKMMQNGYTQGCMYSK